MVKDSWGVRPVRPVLSLCFLGFSLFWLLFVGADTTRPGMDRDASGGNECWLYYVGL